MKYKTSPTSNTMQLARVPVEDEIWATEDGRKLAVADMCEDHVRNALRHVIYRSRYRQLLNDMISLQHLDDVMLDWLAAYKNWRLYLP